jgi:spore germination cell wall hydrolase CwlJ-like protein
MQMHTHLETVQGELNNLEQTAASFRRNLQDSDFERSRLEKILEEANSRIAQLNTAVEASKARNETWQTRLERMQDQLQHAGESAGRMRAEVAESEKQVAAFSARLDESNSTRHALQGKLQTAYSEAEQLKRELKSAQSKVVELEFSLKGKQEKPHDAMSNPEHSKIRPERSRVGNVSPESSSGAEGLRKESLDAVWSEQRDAPLELGHDGRDYLIRTLVFEASGETEIGKAAVAHVILNRKRMGRWGHKIKDVVTSPWQFEPWMTRKSEIVALSRSDPRYLEAAELADDVLAGHIPDPTAGATHFLNPVIVQKRRGGSLPSWADRDGQPIGRHVFYCPECDGTKSTRAAALQSGKMPEEATKARISAASDPERT